MRISNIYIENFRNFQCLDVDLGDHAVFVGENKIGKSNLLHALRLVLDPSLPDSARQLRDEDFWDGLPRPLAKEDKIVVSVDLTDFEEIENQRGLLVEHLIEPEPMVARLTYLFRPLPTLQNNPVKESDYEFLIYGGDKPDNPITHMVRRRMPLDVLPALRDAEGDLANWRRSPLKPLLDEVARQINRADLETIAGQVSEATHAVAEVSEMKSLAKRISARLVEMVGSSHAVEMLLGFSPTDPERLLRALRLFIDAGRRSISEASLGSANLLYLALKSLELEQFVTEGSRDHTFLAIEEPEAHIHPHLQRLVYRDFLRPRARDEDQDRSSEQRAVLQSTILTTHSPHVVSVTPLRSLVVLRKTADRCSTEAVSVADLDLDEKDVKDLERYLDVTRGEMLFANGVLLVEGDAELYLLPVLGKIIGVGFDALGMTVCSVSGTNFAPYVRLLGPKGLNIPFVVITDLDPREGSVNRGEKLVLKLLSEVMDPDEYDKAEPEQLLGFAPKVGFFLNNYTLEVELFRCGRHKSMSQTVIELSSSRSARDRARAWMEKPRTLDPEQLLKDIQAIGKGRFAQRLATRLKKGPCPEYIEKSIRYVVKRCR